MTFFLQLITKRYGVFSTKNALFVRHVKLMVGILKLAADYRCEKALGERILRGLRQGLIPSLGDLQRRYETPLTIDPLQLARQNLLLPKALDRLDRYGLLILDDIGYVRKDDAETHVLFELIAHRYESKSLMVTSNQPFGEWDQIFPTNAMTVAAIDRLVHHATLFEIVTESYRRLQATEKAS